MQDQAPAPKPVDMMELLRSLGFREGPPQFGATTVYLDVGVGTVEAMESWTIVGKPAVQLGGIFNNGRSIGMLETQVSRELSCREEGLALIAYYLDAHLSGFRGANMPAFVAEGVALCDFLPWRRQWAKEAEERRQRCIIFDARPHCTVDRPAARFALNWLAKELECVDPDQRVVFSFDGEILRVSLVAAMHPLAARGELWAVKYAVRAGQLRDLPKRLNSSAVVFGVWQGEFTIARKAYPLVQETS